MTHLECLPIREVLVGTTVEVEQDGHTHAHTLPPGLASYLIARHPSLVHLVDPERNTA